MNHSRRGRKGRGGRQRKGSPPLPVRSEHLSGAVGGVVGDVLNRRGLGGAGEGHGVEVVEVGLFPLHSGQDDDIGSGGAQRRRQEGG